ncbi:hypothetical protein RRG08_020072 [Elysia crispata]|uniref:Uncharacterized protein n=1 Tax=Elysia crispata TaxID=231223 RepID=A0AAE1DLP8_9GAST|nr:hypothetical protein RRG08_020072 [Elysia crispata]
MPKKLGPGSEGGGPLGPGAAWWATWSWGRGRWWATGPGAAGKSLGFDEEPDGISGRSVTKEAAKSLSVKTARFMGHIPVALERLNQVVLCRSSGSSLPAMPGIS